jgi:hypothetical protein
MDYTLLTVIIVFTLIVVGVGTYKHYKKKARNLKNKLDEINGDTSDEVSSSSGGGSKNTGVTQQVK